MPHSPPIAGEVMATLKNSRGKFFEVHKMPRDRSFWNYLLEQQGALDKIPANDLTRLRAWQPERSNCPELTNVIESLIGKVPAEWRALASNIFVGRVLYDGEANSQAWTKVQAGIIEINLQYTWVLSAYVAAFDDYAQMVGNLIEKILEPDEEAEQVVRLLDARLSEGRSWLDDSRPGWQDYRLLSSGNAAMLQSSPPERVQNRENAVLACEEFTVAHELAHHLLWHTVSRKGQSKAWRTVEETIENAGLAEMLEKQNASQRQELHADILAFMMTADTIGRTPSFGDLYRALFGNMLTHIALADMTERWAEADPGATHPGFAVRFDVTAALVEWLSESRPVGSLGDLPLGLLVQLQGFCGLALNAWVNRKAPDRQRRATILDLVDYTLRRGQEMAGRIPPGYSA